MIFPISTDPKELTMVVKKRSMEMARLLTSGSTTYYNILMAGVLQPFARNYYK